MLFFVIPDNFDPSKGTVSRAIAVCPVCGYTVDAKITRKLFQEGKARERIVAVVLHKPGTKGKRYRLVTEKDMEIFREAGRYFEKLRKGTMRSMQRLWWDLGITVNRMADFESNLCRWHPQWKFIPNTFARQALPITWDYVELNLFSPILTGTWNSIFGQILETISHLSSIPAVKKEVRE